METSLRLTSLTFATVLCAVLLGYPSQQAQAQAQGDPPARASARVIVKLKADSPVVRGRVFRASDEHQRRARALGDRKSVV